jgi:DNA-binding NarL/FixJ family response regulator
MPTTVAIVEDNAPLAASLRRVLNAADDCECVGTSSTAEEALRTIPRLQPDVVIMDIELPDTSGIACTARLKELDPSLQILILTVYNDNRKIFEALEAGASGYLLKRSSADEIVRAVRDVKEGGSPMSAEIARKVVQSFRKPGPAAGGVESLTAREAEILALLAKGYASKEIADQLSISHRTVCGHLGKIYEKLHVRSRTEAVIKYLHG